MYICDFRNCVYIVCFPIDVFLWFNLIQGFNKKSLYKIHGKSCLFERHIVFTEWCSFWINKIHYGEILTCAASDHVPFLEISLGNKSWKYIKFKTFCCHQTLGEEPTLPITGTNKSLLWRSGIWFPQLFIISSSPQIRVFTLAKSRTTGSGLRQQ